MGSKEGNERNRDRSNNQHRIIKQNKKEEEKVGQ